MNATKKQIRRVGRNLFLECVAASVKKGLDNGVMQRAIEDCATRFVIFHVLHFIAYTYAVEAADETEEKGRLRFAVKRYWRECEHIYDRYQSATHASMDEPSWFLLQDFQTAAYADLEPSLDMFRMCCANYMYKNKYKNNVDILSRLAVALKMGQMISAVWDTFFSSYKEMSGLDLAPQYRFADLTQFFRTLDLMFNELSKGEPTLDFEDNMECKNAYIIIGRRIADEDFLDTAAKKALRFSDKLRKEYAHVLNTETETK